MLTVCNIKNFLSITSQDEQFIKQNRQHFANNKQVVENALSQWCQQHNFWLQPDHPILINGYYEALINGDYHEEFYGIQYQQGVHWFKTGLSEAQATLLIGQLRKQMIMVCNELENNALSYAYCHVLDIGQAIMSTVYSLNHMLTRMRHKAENEIKRIKRAFSLVNVDAPNALMKAYTDSTMEISRLLHCSRRRDWSEFNADQSAWM